MANDAPSSAPPGSPKLSRAVASLISQVPIERPSPIPPGYCLKFRSSYSGLCAASALRTDWLALKLSWVLTPTLGAPVLVFRDEDVAEADELERLIAKNAAEVRLSHAALAKHEKDARQKHSAAVAKVRRLHKRLIALAIGYSVEHLRDVLGRRLLLCFPDYWTLESGRFA